MSATTDPSPWKLRDPFQISDLPLSLLSVLWSFLYLYLDIDECDNNPCNSGTCTNTRGGYKCTCPPEWEGDECQSKPHKVLDRYSCRHNLAWCYRSFVAQVYFNAFESANLFEFASSLDNLPASSVNVIWFRTKVYLYCAYTIEYIY